jgi:hypothetical protein
MTLIRLMPGNSFDQLQEFFSVGLGKLKEFVSHVLEASHSQMGIDLVVIRRFQEHHRGDNGLEQWLVVHLRANLDALKLVAANVYGNSLGFGQHSRSRWRGNLQSRARTSQNWQLFAGLSCYSRSNRYLPTGMRSS